MSGDVAQRTPEEIEADLLRTRAELTASVDELADILSPKRQLAEAKKNIKNAAERSADSATYAVRGLVAEVKNGNPKVIGIIGGVAVATVVIAVVARRR